MMIEIKEETSIPEQKRFFSKKVLDAASESETGVVSVFLADRKIRANSYASLHQYITRNHLRDRFKVAMRECTVYVQEMRDGGGNEA